MCFMFAVSRILSRRLRAVHMANMRLSPDRQRGQHQDTPTAGRIHRRVSPHVMQFPQTAIEANRFSVKKIIKNSFASGRCGNVISIGL